MELLDIDEIIAKEPTFQSIMADGIVTDDELHEQSGGSPSNTSDI